MKSISQSMQEHLNGEAITLCRCWILTRGDGLKFGFTDHDEAISIEGVNCCPESGMQTSNIEQSLGFNVNTQDVTSALNSTQLLESDIERGKLDGSVVDQYVVNWGEPDQYFLESRNLVGEISRSDGVFRAELRSITARLGQNRSRHYVKKCQIDLGGTDCGVDLTLPLYRGSGTVISVKSPIVLEVAGLANFSASSFKGGLLTWSSGVSIHDNIEIAEHIIEADRVFLHLWKPMGKLPADGDTFEVRVGCDKSFSTCRNRFMNSENFQGFPHMPGNDFASSYASNSSNMDGGPLVQ